MIRTVYCPSEDFLKEAAELADRHSLSITVGESESMTDLEFDRNSVCVVYIPTIHALSLGSKEIPCGFTQAFEYMCDYVDFKKSAPVIEIRKEGSDSVELSIEPSYMESHISRFTVRIVEPGKYYGSVVIDGLVFAETEMFEVFD